MPHVTTNHTGLPDSRPSNHVNQRAMGRGGSKVLASIPTEVKDFCNEQRMFFVCTAATSVTQHVNISPKANEGTFTVIDKNRIAYLDKTGSGCETSVHLEENSRITIMFVALSGSPEIIRLHGR